MKTYPLESLLRSPLEWWSALVCISAGIFMMSHPYTFLLMPVMSKTMGGILLLLGGLRC